MIDNPDFLYSIPRPPTFKEARIDPITLNIEDQIATWESEIGHFAMGTQSYHQPEGSDWSYTDGVRRVAEIFNAWWLVDELLSHPENKGRQCEHVGSIQFAKITSCKGNSIVEYYDDSSEHNSDRVVTWTSAYGRSVLERPNFYTLFPDKSLPIDEIVFCRQGGVVYLMKEH